MKSVAIIVCLLLSHFALSDFKVDVIAEGLNKPWGLAKLPDGRFLVTEKKGDLRFIDADGSVSPPITGLPLISAVGQGGLLDVILHPQFSGTQLIYFSFVAGSSFDGYGTEVMRAKLLGNRLVDQKVIFTALPKVRGGRHFGSRLLFDTEDYLFISLGDRGRRDEAQNLGSHIGTVVRLQSDGSIPKDNPFISTPNAKPEIFSYGHRNVQGLALHPKTGQVWAHEHGPQGGDEINVLDVGKNYGWPVITYGAEYGTGFKIGEGVVKSGMQQPIHFWDPSIAPSGMAFFEDDLFIGALKFQLLARLSLQEKAVTKVQRLYEGKFGRIRDVKAFGGDNSNANAIYLLTDAANGKLIRLTKIVK
ncbi:MAG: glucose/arabinose dehydrogenase [Cellvibrionaceae bacterium]|jgi:glucose/arabinose dehydrogenase